MKKNLKTVIKWSEKRQQTAQAEKVYSSVLLRDEEIITFLITKISISFIVIGLTHSHFH